MSDHTTISVSPEIRDHLLKLKYEDESLEDCLTRLCVEAVCYDGPRPPSN